MKLKENTDILAFLKTVQRCSGDVYFRTDDGDNLNLKSKLSQFLFAALIEKPWLLNKGAICCDREDDYDLLRNYVI